MISWISEVIIPYAYTVPIEVFAFFFSILEEIIPPIPSLPVMIIAGSLAKIQNYHILSILFLAFISSSGKTIGAVLVYKVVSKLEGLFFKRYGPTFKLNPEKIESFGKKLGQGKSDYLILTLLRAFPLIPSTLISVGSGILKIPIKLFIISTFIGTIIRDSIYLYIGFTGTKVLHNHFFNSDSQYLVRITIGTIILAILIYLYLKLRKPNAPHQ